MTKVTYLLGAGASYHAVPVVGKMEARLGEIVKYPATEGRFVSPSDDNQEESLEIPQDLGQHLWLGFC